jgi:endonuclease/exonuclease/phosphatase family metal-dependent hydrolase
LSRRRFSRRSVAATVIALPWTLWAVGRLAELDRGHPLVALMALTPYAAVTAPIPVAVALVLRRWLVATIAAGAAVALAAVVLPRAIPDGDQVLGREQGPALTVMTANLYEGRADAGALIALAREQRVDVLSLQELTPDALARLDSAGARELFPGRVVAPRPGAIGSGLMARRRLSLAGEVAPRGTAEPEAALAVPGTMPVRVKAVHPPAPLSSHAAWVWARALRRLPDPGGDQMLRLLAGDFNGTLDHHEIRALLDRGYVDAADAGGAGLQPTWPSSGIRPRIVIDHVLVPRSVRVHRVTVHALPGSDHRALIAEVVLPSR